MDDVLEYFIHWVGGYVYVASIFGSGGIRLLGHQDSERYKKYPHIDKILR